MKQRTLEIIAICKGNTSYNKEGFFITNIIDFLSDTCMCDKEYYSENVLERILLDAMYDYLDNCDKHSDFLKTMENVAFHNYSLSMKICMSFRGVQVCNEYGGYINGFSEEYNTIINNLKIVKF